MLRLLGEDVFNTALWISRELLLFCLLLTSPYTVLNYTFACDFRGLISKIIGCASTPGLKMPIMYLPWLYLFKSVSVFLFHTLLLHLFTLLTCCAPALTTTHVHCRISFYIGFWRSSGKFSQSQLFGARCSATKCVLPWWCDESYHRKTNGAYFRPLKQHTVCFSFVNFVEQSNLGRNWKLLFGSFLAFQYFGNVGSVCVHTTLRVCLCVCVWTYQVFPSFQRNPCRVWFVATVINVSEGTVTHVQANGHCLPRRTCHTECGQCMMWQWQPSGVDRTHFIAIGWGCDIASRTSPKF